MLNNNISNRKAPSILFRVEDFLVKHKETSLDKVVTKVTGKYVRADFNDEVVNVIETIFRATDFTVGLVCVESEWKKYPKDIKEIMMTGLPLSDIHLVFDSLDIELLLNSGRYTYYVDDNLNNHSLIGHKRCITLDQINSIARKGYLYE